MEQDRSASDASPLVQEAADSQTAPERLVELGAIGEIRPLVAANAGTPSAYLEELSKDKNEQVRRAVAQNPNTSLDCLLHLAREFSEAFFLNPLCSLLDLAQPGWYAQIEDPTWLALLKSEKIPRRWLNWVEEQKRSKGTAMNSDWRRPRDPYSVWIAARLHIDMPELHANGEHIERELAQGIAIVARHEHTPAPLLAELAAIVCQYDGVMEIGNAVCEQVRRDVAENVAAPEKSMRLLAADMDQKVRYRIGRNPRTPVDILEQLAADASTYVRSSVAANPSAPVALLERLAFDNTYEEKYAYAQQQIVPKARLHDATRMQAQEALNNVKLVKGALAGNEATPIHALMHMASHSEYAVRERLAANSVVPEETLLGLVTDSESVLWTLVEKNLHTPAEALVRLAPHENARVRIGVANHPNTPINILAHLAHDNHVRVREAVAKNPRTPVQTLESLMEYGDAVDATDTVIRIALAKNPAVSPDLLARLASRQTRTITSALAKNPHLPTELIGRLIEDEDEGVRQQIASHPSVSQANLERLAQDTNAQVQRIAQRRLDKWHELGERGQQSYPYQGDLDDTEKAGLRSSAIASMPFYEIQRRAQELGPDTLLDFLAHFQLSAHTRTELFTLLLPSWVQKWKQHMWQIQAWLDLLAEFDLSAEWQRVLASSPLWQERYAMAVKPASETALLEQLADDGNRYVRAAARWYLQQRSEITPS